MGYLFFNADRSDFDDGQGNEVSLGEHLEYVDQYCGTPDCWDSTETENRKQAIMEAEQSGLHLYIVCDTLYRVVGEVNKD